MMEIILAGVVSLVITLAAGKLLIPALIRLKAGQSIKEVGPTWHKGKQGTPTMGGLMFIIGIGIAVFKFSRLGNDSISALNLRLAGRPAPPTAGSAH